MLGAPDPVVAAGTRVRRCFKPRLSDTLTPLLLPTVFTLPHLHPSSTPAPVLPVYHFNAAFAKKIKDFYKGVREGGRSGLTQCHPRKM